jgi:hypothetical protein
MEQMKKFSVTWWRATILIILFLLTGVFGIGCRDMGESFLGLLFDDAALSKDSNPLPPGWNPSGPLLVGCVPTSEIKRVVFVRLLPIIPKESGSFPSYDSSNWGYQYPGFPKVELTPNQLEKVLTVFRKAKLFAQYDVQKYLCQDKTVYDADDYPCCDNGVVPSIVSKIVKETPSINRTYYDVKHDAIYKGHVAELQVYLPRRRIARVEIYWDKQMVAFSTGHTYQLQISGVGSEPLPLITSLYNRTQVPPLEVEFPFENSASALKRAQRRFGKSYDRAIKFFNDWKGIDSVFGKMNDIRPAKGLNHEGAWADSSWFEYTFQVSDGSKKGLVLISDSYKQLLYDQKIYEF